MRSTKSTYKVGERTLVKKKKNKIRLSSSKLSDLILIKINFNMKVFAAFSRLGGVYYVSHPSLLLQFIN